MKTNAKRSVGITVVAALAALSLWAGIRPSPAASCAIWIDASRPVSIEAPFEVVEIGAHGELGLVLAAGAGKGWRGEAGGKADYNFYTPQAGKYAIWAYSLWHDSCTDAVYVQVDGMAKANLGKDPQYNRWHWVKGFEVPLDAGGHVLHLSNHSDNIAIQKLFLTNDPQQVPPDADPALADELFIDDFNGCDKGNFPEWKIKSGQWEVLHRPDRKDPSDNALVGRSSDQAVIALKDRGWKDYRLTVSVMSPSAISPDSSIGIRFGVQDDEQGQKTFNEIRWAQLAGEAKAVLTHIRSNDGTVEKFTSHIVPWKHGQWHEVQLDLKDGQAEILIDGGSRVSCGRCGEISGGIGLALSGPTEAHFDNVRVRALKP